MSPAEFTEQTANSHLLFPASQVPTGCSLCLPEKHTNAGLKLLQCQTVLSTDYLLVLGMQRQDTVSPLGGAPTIRGKRDKTGWPVLEQRVEKILLRKQGILLETVRQASQDTCLKCLKRWIEFSRWVWMDTLGPLRNKAMFQVVGCWACLLQGSLKSYKWGWEVSAFTSMPSLELLLQPLLIGWPHPSVQPAASPGLPAWMCAPPSILNPSPCSLLCLELHLSVKPPHIPGQTKMPAPLHFPCGCFARLCLRPTKVWI